MGLVRSSTPTLVDIAREAGVSLKTASRALNHERYISVQTAAKVQATMLRLGYQANELARGLKARRSAAVGMIVPNLADPFTSAIARAVQDVAKMNQHAVILAGSGGDPAVEAEEISALMRRQVDGLLIAPADSKQESFSSSIPQGMPVVCFDQAANFSEMHSITVTNQRGARTATDHLLEHGYRCILAIGARPHLYTCNQRSIGYRKSMRKAGLETNLLLVEHESKLTPERLAAALAELPETQPIALFTMNWVVTVLVLKALKKLHRVIDKNCALISFDDFDLAEVLTPSLTVIRQPAADMGRIAAEMLFAAISGQTAGSGKHTVLPTEFVIRQSCGCNTV